VKFLVDHNRSPRLAESLRAAGHDAVHTGELGLERASDTDLFDLAAAEGRVIVSGDTDFSAILASRRVASPSVILMRLRRHRREAEQAALLLANLDAIEAELAAGAIVVLLDDRIRLRRLPLGDQESDR